MAKWAVAGIALATAMALAAQAAEPVSQKQTELREALRVQQLICQAMADVRARGASYADNNFSLCFIQLEELRAEYQQAFGEAGAVAPAITAGAAARVATAGGAAH